jgi:hypothetical protein
VCERNGTSPRCQGSDPRGNGQDERRRQEEDQCQLCANTALDSGPLRYRVSLQIKSLSLFLSLRDTGAAACF